MSTEPDNKYDEGGSRLSFATYKIRINIKHFV